MGVDHYCVAPWRMKELEQAERERDVLMSECEKLRSELARYKTPLVDDVEFLPSDPKNHEVRG